MILTAAILFFTTMAGGLLFNLLGQKSHSVRLPLLFAGSFLFAVTIIHILPEVFTTSSNPFTVGLFVLAGFFFQQFLEYLTKGVEHGNVYKINESNSTKFYVLLGLAMHSILEGGLLTHDSPFHEEHESYSLLVGIVLHKVPAAFALMAVFKTTPKMSRQQWLILIFFSLASPLGLYLTNYLEYFSQEAIYLFFAFVSGGFLHISTTIFVETGPQQQFRLNRIMVSLLGAGVAILAEYLA